MPRLRTKLWWQAESWNFRNGYSTDWERSCCAFWYFFNHAHAYCSYEFELSLCLREDEQNTSPLPPT
ncbi:hypothetical protein AC578_5407 [Pseudocercospora eumusae]|uniref:Uncharacterized protein n=1 Tax=Pseudocercospora eumusae TaxID=321146 RepID=A0A139HK09_9PEZI|nr:hypothetical protein AC578_5407 [Pseudocercospora eumusae]